MSARIYAVTGAASGIGAAVTAHLKAQGHRVVACDRREGDVAADLSTAEGREALVGGVTRLSGGRLDGIVANAGGGPPETMLAVNYFGTLATLEGLRPLLAGSAAPRAVTTSSIACLQPVDPALVAACLAGDEAAAVALGEKAIAEGRAGDLYAAAKRALNTWCRRAAVTDAWAGAAIPLNVAAPGVIETPAAAWILDNPEIREEMGKRTPLPTVRPGKPADMAALIAWLAGPENVLMTGQVLYADGGLETLARGEAVW